ncbi:MAG: MgtC/SapB family protein [Patescibacteria group bacterium]
MTEQLLFLQNLGFALLLGLLIGVEREKTAHNGQHFSIGGVRTMGLVSMLGYLSYALFYDDTLVFGLLTGAFLALIISAYVVSSLLEKKAGATTELAALFVFLTGVLVARGETLIATVIALTVLVLLFFKQTLHSFALNLKKEEFYDTIKFILVVFVIFPLLPNQTFGPLDVLNPYTIWLVVVLVSTISFLSYVAIKVIGPKRGIGFSGFFGGLFSSTAVAVSFSQLSQHAKKLADLFVFGILIASSSMFFRVLLEVSVLNPSLTKGLLIPMISMGATGFLISGYFWFKKKTESSKALEGTELHLHSPFQLSSALKFGLLFASMLFISKFVTTYFGSEALYLTAFFSGFLDVDAITVSMANLTRSNDVMMHEGITAITIAAITNTLTKGGIVVFFGTREVGRRVLLSMLLIIAAGLLSLFLT